jgi:hypothetical protein
MKYRDKVQVLVISSFGEKGEGKSNLNFHLHPKLLGGGTRKIL